MTLQDGSLAAPQEPVAPVNDAPVAEEPTDYSSPDDIEFELTPEQEQDYVNQILNEGTYTPPAVEPVVEESVVEEPVVTPPTAEPVVEPPKPATETPEEIAAPQSDDLWIEVEQTTIDDLGDEVTTVVKLAYDPSDPSSFIPDDFTAKSTKQLAEIMEAKAEMAKIYGDRQAEYDSAQSVKDGEAKAQLQLAAWDTEIKDLVEAGVIPSQEEDADAYTEKTDAVFKFMLEENNKRMSEGRPVITAFGTAYTMYENNEAVKAAREAEKQEIIDTKTKGGMIGGGSASSGGAPQKQAYVAGSARNIWDIKIDG